MQCVAPARLDDGLRAVCVHPSTLRVGVHVATYHAVPDAKFDLTDWALPVPVILRPIRSSTFGHLLPHKALAAHHRPYHQLRYPGHDKRWRVFLLTLQAAVLTALRFARLHRCVGSPRLLLSRLHHTAIPHTSQRQRSAEGDSTISLSMLRLAQLAAEIVPRGPTPHPTLRDPRVRWRHHIEASVSRTHQPGTCLKLPWPIFTPRRLPLSARPFRSVVQTTGELLTVRATTKLVRHPIHVHVHRSRAPE
mmetsp:Transcript_60805/g.125268  ORF Transcript_60805/g.125268 Transcript_60805/m.125268 type:complete len:249 (-) Transcript_60805:323-1069(-)